MDKGLQELVRRYFQGELSYGQYRNARGRLIDTLAGTDASDTLSAITAPHVRAPAVQPLPQSIPQSQTVPVRAPPQTVEQFDTQSQTQMRPRRAPLVTSTATPKPSRATPVVSSAASVEPAKAGGGRGLWMIGAGALMLLSVIGGALVYTQRAPAPAQTVAVSEAQQRTAGQDILAAFMRTNDWSAGGIDSFSRQWDALDPVARQAARHTPEFQRVADALYQRIAEQRALDDAAGAPPSQGKQVITAFAQYLGIDYASLQAGAATAPPQPSVPAPDKPAEQTAKRESLPATVSEAAPPLIPPSVETPKDPDQPAVIATAPAIAATATPAAAVAQKAKAAADNKTNASTAGSAGACRVALLGTRRPFCSDRVAEGVDAPLMVVIPGGEFQMGSAKTDAEQPPHPVRIARAFAMSVYEVSVAEFQHYCQLAHSTCPPAHWPADDYPVVAVSWRDAEEYVRWLSQVTGQRYRLPSEAEWEYAARAGTTTAYPGGDELLITDARFSVDKPETTPLPRSDHSINRNRFKLAHMAGNVREWVQDAWQNNYQGAPADGSARAGGAGERVVRGGSYADHAGNLRSSARAHLPSETRDAVTGIRIVRELAE